MGDLNKDTPTSIVGVVSSKQKSFGFIRSHLPTDTFFHKSACEQYLFESLKVGDAVSFQLDTASQPGKRVAAHVTSSDQQPLLERVDPTELYGRVVKTPDNPAAGILRYVLRPGKVQHLTFTPSDVCASGTDLEAGQPVRFKLLTDERQKQSVAASGASSSQHAVHAYMRATDVTPIRQDDMVSIWQLSQPSQDCRASSRQQGQFETSSHACLLLESCVAAMHLQDIHVASCSTANRQDIFCWLH
jgi:cold shock CspA family protein